MASLKIELDEEVLQRASQRAREQGTSVSALLRDYLEDFAQEEESRERAIQELLDLSRRAESGRGDRRWTRDELYER
jgi:Arc/MetJ family transcription regulator